MLKKPELFYYVAFRKNDKNFFLKDAAQCEWRISAATFKVISNTCRVSFFVCCVMKQSLLEAVPAAHTQSQSVYIEPETTRDDSFRAAIRWCDIKGRIIYHQDMMTLKWGTSYCFMASVEFFPNDMPSWWYYSCRQSTRHRTISDTALSYQILT